MNASARWQEIVAENLSANALPGFKKSDVTFESIQSGSMAPNGTTGLTSEKFVQPRASGVLNFSPGEIKPTGSPTDMALDGPGFFEIQMADGSKGYSRDGEFKLDTQGFLVTKQGNMVMGENGPLQFDPQNSNPITVAATGEVYQGSEEKGRLRVVEFSDPHLLTQTGGGYFIAQNTALSPHAATGTLVRQGALESSNTSPMREMSSLITALRMYESNQRVAQMQDERMTRTISDLAGTS